MHLHFAFKDFDTVVFVLEVDVFDQFPNIFIRELKVIGIFYVRDVDDWNRPPATKLSSSNWDIPPVRRPSRCSL
jgi:hypothetical protein